MVDGLQLVETLREMRNAGIAPTLQTIPEELLKRGVLASRNSSDLSGVLNWLRAGGVLSDYTINEDRYAALAGAPATTLQALRGLNREQVAFLRAMVALGVTDWCPTNGTRQRQRALPFRAPHAGRRQAVQLP